MKLNSYYNMIPKTIHFCWFSDDSFPVEIKLCLNSWKRILPDYTIRLWTYEDAKSIGSDFVDEALEEKRWAFAADVVRFYAVYKYGGVYMDSDIYLYKRFDEFMEHDGVFTTFLTEEGEDRTGLQAAFFMASAGDRFCKKVLDYYAQRHYRLSDGSFDDTISPIVMEQVATVFGFVSKNRNTQLLGKLHVFSTDYLKPRKKYLRTENTFAEHRIYGSWRKRKLSRRIDLKIAHVWHVIEYFVLAVRNVLVK